MIVLLRDRFIDLTLRKLIARSKGRKTQGFWISRTLLCGWHWRGTCYIQKSHSEHFSGDFFVHQGPVKRMKVCLQIQSSLLLDQSEERRHAPPPISRAGQDVWLDQRHPHTTSAQARPPPTDADDQVQGIRLYGVQFRYLIMQVWMSWKALYIA